MKAYPVTEEELGNLGLLQAVTTAAFSGASGLGGFWLSVRQNLAFADAVNPAVKAYWDALAMAAFYGACVLVVVGALLVWRGFSTVGKIKKGTRHP